MPWSIEWTVQAMRDLSGLDHQIARRVVAKFEQTKNNPFRYFSRLVGGDEYKLRIGDYRLIALLIHATRTIVVERVDHRSRIYERAP